VSVAENRCSDPENSDPLSVLGFINTAVPKPGGKLEEEIGPQKWVTKAITIKIQPRITARRDGSFSVCFCLLFTKTCFSFLAFFLWRDFD